MRRAVFLDRDGTLIRNHHYGCDPDGIELLDGVPEGLGLLKRAGYLLIVVTNQSGIARGFFTEGQLAAMHRRLDELLDARGAAVDGWYYCPHHPEGAVPEYTQVCECRKPAPGMVLRGCADFDVDPSASWLIGDILDDVEAGKRVGARAILMDLGTEGEPERPERKPDYVARSFPEAVRHILESEPGVGQGPVSRGVGGPAEPPPPACSDHFSRSYRARLKSPLRQGGAAGHKTPSYAGSRAGETPALPGEGESDASSGVEGVRRRG